MKSTDITQAGWYWHHPADGDPLSVWDVVQVCKWTIPDGDIAFFCGDYDDLRRMEGQFIGPIEPPESIPFDPASLGNGWRDSAAPEGLAPIEPPEEFTVEFGAREAQQTPATPLRGQWKDWVDKTTANNKTLNLVTGAIEDPDIVAAPSVERAYAFLDAHYPQGNWHHPDGDRIAGWRIPTSTTDAMCMALPREFVEHPQVASKQ